MAGPVCIMAAMNPSAEGRLRQFVILPDRLPWLQEGASFGTQHPPLVEILMLGEAQHMLLAVEEGPDRPPRQETKQRSGHARSARLPRAGRLPPWVSLRPGMRGSAERPLDFCRRRNQGR